MLTGTGAALPGLTELACRFPGSSQPRTRGAGPTPGLALRRLPLGVVNHVHLRDVRSEDLDLGPATAQVHQRPAREEITPGSETGPTQLHLSTRFSLRILAECQV